MTDSLLPTRRLVEDADRFIRANDRHNLLDTRNKLRSRVALLEGRLTRADDQFSYVTDGVPWDQEFDRMPAQHAPVYLSLLTEYEQAFDALARADAAL